MNRFSSQIAAHLNSDESQRSNTQLTYQGSVAAAHDYDGSEASELRVYTILQAFEACTREIAQRHGIDLAEPSVRDAFELAVASVAAPQVTPLNVDAILGLAIESFGRRLRAGKVALQVVETDLRFLPTRGVNPIVEGDVARPIEEVRIEPRTADLIQALNRYGIYTDDIIIYKGALAPRVLRQRPYSLIQIPRLKREILICDAVKQATYVGTRVHGPQFWGTHGKADVLERDGVVRIINSGDWLEKIIKVVLEDNHPGPKRNLKLFPGRTDKLQLSEDLILRKALEYAATHDGSLPSRTSGDVSGLMDQTWENVEVSLLNRTRGLTRHGLTSLAALFRLYGLITIGRSVNPMAVLDAIDALHSTGSHGLMPENNFNLTEDVILRKALEYAAVHDFELPDNNSGEVDGFPGQTWMKWSSALRRKAFGLEREGVRGLSGLFRIYGLKTSIKGNREAIKQAITAITTTGVHGLAVVGETKLSEDLILNKALTYAAANNGLLPGKESGEVDGMAGQNWGAWNAALRSKSNGLKRDGLAGLPDLYRVFGLMMGRKENPVAISKAIETLNATQTHGLMAVGDLRLTEDLIIGKALQFASKHNGKLPVPESGEVDGLPGQKWMNWHAAIRNTSQGLTLGGLSGLPSLLQAYGLKNGRVENATVVEEAWHRHQTEGHHGLVFDANRLKPARPASVVPALMKPARSPK